VASKMRVAGPSNGQNLAQRGGSSHPFIFFILF